jgi:hypothetical protein
MLRQWRARAEDVRHNGFYWRAAHTLAAALSLPYRF